MHRTKELFLISFGKSLGGAFVRMFDDQAIYALQKTNLNLLCDKKTFQGLTSVLPLLDYVPLVLVWGKNGGQQI